MLKKPSHNHYFNQTNPKPQPKQKTNPKKQPEKTLPHTELLQQQNQKKKNSSLPQINRIPKQSLRADWLFAF